MLFDAIEQSFEINDIYGVISDLYEGTGTDYIKCQECGHESLHQAKFFDLQLTVRNEFENVKIYLKSYHSSNIMIQLRRLSIII